MGGISMSARTADITQTTERLDSYLVAFFADNGYSPRRRDIYDDLGITEYQLDRALARLRGAKRVCEGSTLPTVCLASPSSPSTK